MRAYTNLDQSMKLAKILPIKSADMHYQYDYNFEELESIPTITEEDDHFVLFPKDVRCWSLTALLEILPENIHIKDWENYIICIDKDSICYKRKEDMLSQTILYKSQSTNLVDACYEMIIRLHELNLL